MSKILAIDSSTEACSVALQNEENIVNRFEIAPRRHAELLLPMVDSVLKEADISLSQLDAIACCVGPGAFTGLRIAISVAQGLAYAAKLPCISISSLQILAAEAFSTGEHSVCLSSIDARMNEVYFGAYVSGPSALPLEVHPQQVIASENIQLNQAVVSVLNESITSHKNPVKVGNGWDHYKYPRNIAELPFSEIELRYPNAQSMLAIANHCFENNELLKPEFLQPVYLRNDVAKKKSQQK